MNKKQKICLWGGAGIIDLVGVLTLCDRVTKSIYLAPGRISRYFSWSAADFLILVLLIAITTAVLIYSLKDKSQKPTKNNK